MALESERDCSARRVSNWISSARSLDVILVLHHIFRVNRMARRSVPPPKPTPPVLTLEQKRYRIERFRKCIRHLEAFDPQKVQRRFGVPEVLTLEAGIDKALSATFGYGTPLYLRYNLAARLDNGPFITNAALHSTVLRLVGGPGSHDGQEAQEARRYFSEGKERSIALLRQAICTLEDEIVDAQPIVGVTQSEVTQTAGEIRTLQPRLWGGIEAAWRRVGRWWWRRN